MVLQNGLQDQVNLLKEELQEGVGTDLINWRFIFGRAQEIQELFESWITVLYLRKRGWIKS